MNSDLEVGCELYVQSDKPLHAMRLKIAEFVKGELRGSYIESDLIWIDYELSDFRNNSKINEHDGFLYYNHIAWIELSDRFNPEREQLLQIRDLVCDLIIQLRSEGMLVVSTSEFDDYVIEKTGWNWSEDSPVHP